MIFYYHSILGLQYYTIEDKIFLVDMKYLEINKEQLKKFIEDWKIWQSQIGIQFIDTSKPKIEEMHLPIYSNF